MVKLTRESKRIIYLVASIVSLVFMLFFAWTLVQYFFSGNSSVSTVDGTESAQSQTSAGAPRAQSEAQNSHSRGNGGSDSDTSKDQKDSSSEPKSAPSDSGNSTNAVATPVKDKNTVSVRITIDGSAARSSAFTVDLQVQAGTSVYDALLASGVGVNARSTSFGMYVAAINGLAERDHGPQSGWVYSVNGVQPNYTSDAYELHDGDSVVWTYVNAVN